MKYWTKRIPYMAGWYWCRYKIKNHKEYKVRPAQIIIKNNKAEVYLAEMPYFRLDKKSVKFGARITDYPPELDKNIVTLINKINKLYITDLQRGRDGSWHWVGKNGLAMLSLVTKYLKKKGFKILADKCGHSVPMQYIITLGVQEYYMSMKFDPQPYGWDKLSVNEQNKRIVPYLELTAKFPIKVGSTRIGFRIIIDKTFIDKMRLV